MKDFLLVENTKNLNIINHDLSFTNSNAVYVQQKLFIRLSIIKGEYYLNKELGIPYFEEVFIKNANRGYIADLFKLTILQTPGVEELLFFSIVYQGQERTMNLTFSVKITTGEILNITYTP